MPIILRFAFFRVNALRIVKIVIENMLKLSKPLFGHPSRKSGKDYVFFLTEATFAPWIKNKEFNFDFSKFFTKDIALSKIQLFEIWNKVKEVSFIDGALIEIGVWRGSSLSMIDLANQSTKVNKLVLGFDTFKGVALATDKDPLYVGGEHADTSQDLVKKNLDKYSPNNKIELHVGVFPTETAHFLPNKISFAHIDVDTYESTLLSLRSIWTVLSKGGVIICTDYGSCTATGVPEAVHIFLSEIDNARFTYSIGGSAIITKF